MIKLEVHEDKIMRGLTYNAMKSPFYYKSNKQQ